MSSECLHEAIKKTADEQKRVTCEQSPVVYTPDTVKQNLSTFLVERLPN